MITRLKKSARGTLADRLHFWFTVGRYLKATDAAESAEDPAIWEMRGRPIPPPHTVKQRVIQEFANRYSIGTFIETGTFRGDMVYAMRDIFDQIYSIELSRSLYEAARKRFMSMPHIRIVKGNSAEILPVLLRGVNSRCVFWLDGHYSDGRTARAKRDTPILEELGAIFAHHVKDHVILIDDARLFTGESDYPSFAEVRQVVETNRPVWNCEAVDDVIRIYGRKLA